MKCLQEYIDITDLSNFKTPAVARYFFVIDTPKDLFKLPEILSFARDNNLPFLFLGGGTNILFAFNMYEGVIIKNSLSGWSYDEKTKELTTYSSESIRNIAETLEIDFGQDLWHRFIGLPGSVGGAIFGNAGCFGLETENNLKQVEVYNIITGQIKILSKEECRFSYRNSIFKQTNKYFIISAKFDLSQKIEKYNSSVDNIYFRKYKQPSGNTCGSFFKNPKIHIQQVSKKILDLCEGNLKKITAGFLIEKVGLKGVSLGGAYFSNIHANFLMHDGTGTHKDLIDLIALAQNKVKKYFGITLESEVQIIFNKESTN